VISKPIVNLLSVNFNAELLSTSNEIVLVSSLYDNGVLTLIFNVPPDPPPPLKGEMHETKEKKVILEKSPEEFSLIVVINKS
jgi:hypothetical protein